MNVEDAVDDDFAQRNIDRQINKGTAKRRWVSGGLMELSAKLPAAFRVVKASIAKSLTTLTALPVVQPARYGLLSGSDSSLTDVA